MIKSLLEANYHLEKAIKLMSSNENFSDITYIKARINTLKVVLSNNIRTINSFTEKE